ncbi:MAG: hypothetical protein AAF633_13800 [Chloroflexota bacterium]
MHSQTPRIIFTILIIVYAVLPLFAELNETHVVNPEWPGHARLHNMWLLIQNFLLGLFSLYLIWGKPSREYLLAAGLIGTIILGSFIIAGFTASLYGGTLTDPGAEVLIVNGTDINVYVLGASFMISLIGIGLTYRAKY